MKRSILAAFLTVLASAAAAVQAQTEPLAPPSAGARLILVDRANDGRNIFVEISTLDSGLPQVWVMTAFPAPERSAGTTIDGTWTLMFVDCPNRTVAAGRMSMIRSDGTPTPPQAIEGERMTAWDGAVNPAVYTLACTAGVPEGIRFAGVTSAIRASLPPPDLPPSASVSLSYLTTDDDSNAWFVDLPSLRTRESVWLLTGYAEDKRVGTQSWSGHWTRVDIDCETQAATVKGVAGVTAAGETLALGNRVNITNLEAVTGGDYVFDMVCLGRLPDGVPAASAQRAIAAHREGAG